MRLCLAIILLAIPAIAQSMPRGIPMPGFGITNVMPSDPGVWPGGESSAAYYIDNTHPSATDSGNTYGYPNLPRLTIPSSTTALTNVATLMKIRGGPYALSGNITLNTANHSSNAPLWIDGYGTAGTNGLMVEINGGREIRIRGGNVIAQGLYLTNTAFRSDAGFNVNNVVLQNSHVTKPEALTGAGISSFFGDMLVIRSNWITYCGPWSEAINTTERDVHGIQIGDSQTNVWILDNILAWNAGDGIQINAGQATNAYSSRIFIGRNHFYGNAENAFDIKTGKEIVLSENVFEFCIDSQGSDGTLAVLNDENVTGALGNTNLNIFIIYNHFKRGLNGLRAQCFGYVFGNLFENCTNYAVSAFGGTFSNVVENNTFVNVGVPFDRQTGSTGVTVPARFDFRNNHISSQNSNYSRITGPAITNSLVENNLFPDSGINYIWSGTTYTSLSDFEAAVANANGSLTNAQALNPDHKPIARGPAVDAGLTPVTPAVFSSVFGFSIATNDFGQALPWGVPATWDIGWYEATSRLVLPENTKIAWVGDSITEANMYANVLEAATFLSFPNLKHRPITIGRGGTTANTWTTLPDQEYNARIYAYQPAMVGLMFSHNNGSLSLAQHITSLVHLASDFVIASNNATPILLGAHPKDEPGGDTTIRDDSEATFDIAQTNSWPAVDTWAELIDLWEAVDIDAQSGTATPAIHPGPGGHYWIGATIYNRLGLPTNLVETAVNANGLAAFITNHCSVASVSANAYDGVDFTVTPGRLPLGFIPCDLVALSYNAALANWQRWTLKVTGLNRTNTYDLLIDDVDMDDLTGLELEQGVNLASFTNGPINEIGVAVRNAVWVKQWYTNNACAMEEMGVPRDGVSDFRRRSESAFDAGTNAVDIITLLATELNDIQVLMTNIWTAATPPPFDISVRSQSDPVAPTVTNILRNAIIRSGRLN